MSNARVNGLTLDSLRPRQYITVLHHLPPPIVPHPSLPYHHTLVNTPTPYLQPGRLLQVVSISPPFLAVTLPSLSPTQPSLGPFVIDSRRYAFTSVSPRFLRTLRSSSPNRTPPSLPPPPLLSFDLTPSESPNPNP